MTVLQLYWFRPIHLEFPLEIVKIRARSVDEGASIQSFVFVGVCSDRLGQRVLLFEVVLAIEGGGLYIAEGVLL